MPCVLHAPLRLVLACGAQRGGVVALAPLALRAPPLALWRRLHHRRCLSILAVAAVLRLWRRGVWRSGAVRPSEPKRAAPRRHAAAGVVQRQLRVRVQRHRGTVQPAHACVRQRARAL